MLGTPVVAGEQCANPARIPQIVVSSFPIVALGQERMDRFFGLITDAIAFLYLIIIAAIMSIIAQPRMHGAKAPLLKSINVTWLLISADFLVNASSRRLLMPRVRLMVQCLYSPLFH
jgi:hypothetical protein